MPTRDAVVHEALSFNGDYNGHGYDCSNRFSTDMGRAKEAWCLDFVDDVCRLAGAPLHINTAYVPTLWEYAGEHNARKHSWDALPGDPVIFHWPGGNPDGDHVEMTVHWSNGVLRTIGGNSGPSNVDGYKGVGGVHLHDWSDPVGAQAPFLGAIDLALVTNLSKEFHHPVRPPVTHGYRPLELKSPELHGADVRELQKALNHYLAKVRGKGGVGIATDGVFGTATDACLRSVQHDFQDPFGVAAAHTRKALGLSS